jgi:hypothetical protein
MTQKTLIIMVVAAVLLTIALKWFYRGDDVKMKWSYYPAQGWLRFLAVAWKAVILFVGIWSFFKPALNKMFFPLFFTFIVSAEIHNIYEYRRLKMDKQGPN